MTHPNPKAQPNETQSEEATQIAAQFAGLDNDLIQVEAPDGKPEPRDEILSDEDGGTSTFAPGQRQ
ncbi:hypothetical protein [uncultured Aureimonas sp.]|uniref:hypothetical protein n=1 Tax=uncultured Aureimonas sp. TaxID=1604662 RepID=UPI0025F0CEF8|nr:hypothetical protein [uncultured Aureimonas sp.]